MAAYRILLHDERGDPVHELVHDFPDDDAAIDHTGSLDHPHLMHVWQGERHVAEFRPVAPKPPSRR